ncbi:hypothetical protein QQF64_003528, partial [Cirrhinus molitorella]
MDVMELEAWSGKEVRQQTM